MLRWLKVRAICEEDVVKVLSERKRCVTWTYKTKCKEHNLNFDAEVQLFSVFFIDAPVMHFVLYHYGSSAATL